MKYPEAKKGERPEGAKPDYTVLKELIPEDDYKKILKDQGIHCVKSDEKLRGMSEPPKPEQKCPSCNGLGMYGWKPGADGFEKKIVCTQCHGIGYIGIKPWSKEHLDMWKVKIDLEKLADRVQDIMNRRLNKT